MVSDNGKSKVFKTEGLDVDVSVMSFKGCPEERTESNDLYRIQCFCTQSGCFIDTNNK